MQVWAITATLACSVEVSYRQPKLSADTGFDVCHTVSIDVEILPVCIQKLFYLLWQRELHSGSTCVPVCYCQGSLNAEQFH
jgi:hypothetical protein